MSTDLSSTIVAKSDQLNSDDLIGGPITIKITGVTVRPGTEQPTSIYYEGDNNKPYKPGKSMSRVLVQLWGSDGAQYVGRSITLYRDPTIRFGPMAVGGIRISHMSHIDEQRTLALTEKKGAKKPFVVKPLRAEQPLLTNRQPEMTAEEWVEGYEQRVAAASDRAALDAVQAADAKSLASLARRAPVMNQRAIDAVANRLAQLTTPPSHDGATYAGV